MNKDMQEPPKLKVSADPGLEGAPSEKNIQKEISKKIVGGVKKMFGSKKTEKDDAEKKPSEAKPSYQGQQTEKLFETKDLFSNMSPKKAMKLVGGVLMIVVILAAVYVRFIRKDPIRQETTVVTLPTPTYSETGPIYKPSVYAKDPNFVSIEEAMSVLKQESTTTPLTETTLEPPSLDFNIQFKGVEVK